MALKAGRDKNGQRKRNPQDARERLAARGSRTGRRQGTNARLRTRQRRTVGRR